MNQPHDLDVTAEIASAPAGSLTTGASPEVARWLEGAHSSPGGTRANCGGSASTGAAAVGAGP